jgi:hypothetical protein
MVLVVLGSKVLGSKETPPYTDTERGGGRLAEPGTFRTREPENL